jgi:hypothetical protein
MKGSKHVRSICLEKRERERDDTLERASLLEVNLLDIRDGETDITGWTFPLTRRQSSVDAVLAEGWAKHEWRQTSATISERGSAGRRSERKARREGMGTNCACNG